jgi:hypothetical protein
MLLCLRMILNDHILIIQCFQVQTYEANCQGFGGYIQLCHLNKVACSSTTSRPRSSAIMIAHFLKCHFKFIPIIKWTIPKIHLNRFAVLGGVSLKIRRGRVIFMLARKPAFSKCFKHMPTICIWSSKAPLSMIRMSSK